MSEKSQLIDKLKTNKKSRASYIRAHIGVNVPSQLRALRRRREDMTQKQLADEAEMLQPRISVVERPGETKYNLETLVRLAAALKVGLIVKFVSFSEMLRWQNGFSQDSFDATTIDDDIEFQSEEEELPSVAAAEAGFTPSQVHVRRYPLSSGITFLTATSGTMRAWGEEQKTKSKRPSAADVASEQLPEPTALTQAMN